MEKVDQSSFNDWSRHPVTIALLEMLNSTKELINEQLLNPDVLLAKDGIKYVARLVGNTDIIYQIENLTYKDFNLENEEENVDRIDED